MGLLQALRKRGLIALSLLMIGALVFSAVGCSSQTATQTGPKKLRMGYAGGTCESPTFVAFEKGYFKEEGLDVELVKGDFDTNKEGIATGKLDVTLGLALQWIKPLEQGLNAKLVGGIHTGCIKLLVPKNSSIKSVQDLKGKRIGVPAIGGSQMMFASRVLLNNGVNIADVTWRAFPNTELENVLNKGELDAVALGDPIATMTEEKGNYLTLADSAKDPKYKDEYCCLLLLNGDLIDKDPETAAKVARAVFKAAKWVGQNPQEAAKLIVDKKYVLSSPELNARVLASYNYIPSVQGGYDAILKSAEDLKKMNILDANTNAEEFAKKVFVPLKGVE